MTLILLRILVIYVKSVMHRVLPVKLPQLLAYLVEQIIFYIIINVTLKILVMEIKHANIVLTIHVSLVKTVIILPALVLAKKITLI